MGHSDEITLRSYAKINLSLEVIGRRPDGYHDIRSLMQGIDLYDDIKITKCPQNGTKYNLPHCEIGEVVVYLCTDAKTIPLDMSNLALKGIKAVLDEFGVRGIRFTDDLLVSIDKMLPVAAGIAGGSGNAAVCMLGLNALAGGPLTLRDLMVTGAKVGADVPFSLMMNARGNYSILADSLDGIEESSTAAWTGGIGDVVSPVQPLIRHIVLANPGIQVSTKAAYEAIDAIKGASDGSEGAGTGELFINDFEGYTLKTYPEAAMLRQVMQEELDADVVLMSGSGPTMVAYYEDPDEATAGFARMQRITEQHNTGNNEKGNNWRAWFTSTGTVQPGQTLQ